MKLTVPVFMKPEFREAYLAQFQAVKADRILFCVDREFDPARRDALVRQMKEDIRFFSERGFSCAVWIGSTVGHGVPLAQNNPVGDRYSPLVSVDGIPVSEAFCPLDERFTADICDFVAAFADVGAEFLLLDDDFRMAHESVCCACERHLEKFRALLGEPVTRKDLIEKALRGKAGKWRAAWVRVQGDTLRGFAKSLRAAVDRVNPDLPLAACSIGSAWSVDGVDSIEISEILAGKNKKYLRLHGAPYWVTGRVQRTFAHVIELERVLASFAAGRGMELFYEGDTYPRPSDLVPASHLQLFHLAMIADGQADGILKYLFNYISSPAFDPKYVDRHVRDAEAFARAEALFAGGADLGVRVYEHPHLFDGADLSLTGADESKFQFSSDTVSSAGTMLLGCGIPTVYAGEGVASAIFGENARYFRLPETGVILLDGVSAAIYTSLGADVGLAEVRGFFTADRLQSEKRNGEVFTVGERVKVLDAVLREGTGTDSVGRCEGREFPLAYRYTNAAGQRFFVFAYDTSFVNLPKMRSRMVRGYARADQIFDGLRDLCGGAPMPMLAGHYADLFVFEKRKENGGVRVLLLNFFDDPAENVRLVTDRPYRSVRTRRGNAEIRNGEATLPGTIAPFDYEIVEFDP